MCQVVEVHLIVRTRQWLSQGEGRLWLGGLESCCHQFLLVTRKWVSPQGPHAEWPQGTSRWASLRLGGSNPHCCQTPVASAGTQAGPSDLPLESFSSSQHLLSMDALVPLEKKSEHSGSRNRKWSGADDYRSTGCGWILLYTSSYGLWMFWCSWEGLSSTGRNVPPVRWELMMLEKIVR